MTDHIPPDVDKASISVDKASITPPPGAEEVSFYREHRYDAPWDVPAPYLDMADAAITELLSLYWGVVRERDELRAEAHLSDRAFDVQKQLTEQAEREREQLRTKFLKCSNSLDLARGALAAQEERDIAAAESVGEPPFGCDTSQHLADLLADERAEVERLRSLQGGPAMTDKPAAWWAISEDAFLDALRRVAAGEDPDLVYAEFYANSDHEHVEDDQ